MNSYVDLVLVNQSVDVIASGIMGPRGNGGTIDGGTPSSNGSDSIDGGAP